MTYKIYLDDFCESIFHEMEKTQDGDQGHIVIFNGENKDEVFYTIMERIEPFIKESLQEEV